MSMFERRYRGFRVVNFAAVAILLSLMLGVYFAKTRASTDSAAITHADQQIADEKAQIRLLQAQVASMETPERIEKLSGQYLGMVAVDAKHEIRPQDLASIAPATMPAPATSSTPVSGPVAR